ncbi:uncharacterized protein si:dkey-183i3.6 [Hippoglossus hippoglossus]|uniref:uncharacterized protein si:dkey-183i3.6 n=1 Tax=Hippoglossus hippoglossus TaxID=8267 RepID=UPI00148C1C91|nr:uncharacterized protein si:dkey-183i3.6 [Hippoglossus hippoglossus]
MEAAPSPTHRHSEETSQAVQLTPPASSMTLFRPGIYAVFHYTSELSPSSDHQINEAASGCVSSSNHTEITDVCFGEVFLICLESDGCGEVLKEEAQAALLRVKNEGSRTTEGMLGNSSVLAAVLTVVSVVSLSLLSLMCMCCKRKTKVIHEEDHTYDLQTFQRGGSIFAVMQSRPVTRTNQIPSTTVDIQEEPSQDAADDQSDYENIKQVFTPAHHTGRLEHTYVSPIPNAVYGNGEHFYLLLFSLPFKTENVFVTSFSK